MIDQAYVQMMAQYNAWQNKGVCAVVEKMAMDELTKDRGAFFGSIFGTLNHLIWGDTLWISRFDGGAGPEVAPDKHREITPTIAVWGAERFRLDGRISEWARNVSTLDLTGELTWTSPAAGWTKTAPIGLCVAHFFNHQTHHRGQIHAMLTAAGKSLPDTDLPLMPGVD